jgi:hypothetical protein
MERPPVEFTAEEQPVKVYEAGSGFEAQLLVDWLLGAGIESRIASTAIEPLAGKVPFQIATCPVWVAQRDEARARMELPAFEARLAERGGEAEFCYHCGAALTARTSACPTCGEALDWS